jgi:hypothetical protein
LGLEQILPKAMTAKTHLNYVYSIQYDSYSFDVIKNNFSLNTSKQSVEKTKRRVKDNANHELSFQFSNLIGDQLLFWPAAQVSIDILFDLIKTLVFTRVFKGELTHFLFTLYFCFLLTSE